MNNRFAQHFILLLIAIAAQNVAAESTVPMGEFSRNRLNGWEQKSFTSETRYQLQTVDGVVVLRADSHAAGSGLFKEQSIDLEKTPFLNWSWRVGNRLTGLNEQSKAGDDYAARVYVIVKGGLTFWQTKTINYIWSSNSTKASVWANAFAGDQVMMLALRGAEAPLNVWHSEKRNVRADLQKIFGEDFHSIDAVALMTDTDNSGGQVSAFYGDIWFSKD